MWVFRRNRGVLGFVAAAVMLLHALATASSVYAAPRGPAVFDDVLGWVTICVGSGGSQDDQRSPAGSHGSNKSGACALHCSTLSAAAPVAILPNVPGIDMPVQKALAVSFAAHVAVVDNRLSGSLSNRGPPAGA